MNKIENIIFDFGGVLYDISFERAAKAFENLGFTLPGFQTKYQDIFKQFESGILNPDEFVIQIQKLSDNQISKRDILYAFDQILIGIDAKKVNDLRKLKTNYHLFLLSNTNQIHFRKYSEEIKNNFRTADFYTLFDKEYYSYILKMRKPELSIFDFVIKESNIDPNGTLFVDDSNENIMAATKLGFQTCWINTAESWKNLMKQLNA
jgi:glucose-1-phosphatase